MQKKGKTETGHDMLTECETRRGLNSKRLVLLSWGLPGCGSFCSVRAPCDKSVRTVYVPIFKSQSYRRDLNGQLTDLVIKEIEKRSLYKVVGRPDEADTILEGTVM